MLYIYTSVVCLLLFVLLVVCGIYFPSSEPRILPLVTGAELRFETINELLSFNLSFNIKSLKCLYIQLRELTSFVSLRTFQMDVLALHCWCLSRGLKLIAFRFKEITLYSISYWVQIAIHLCWCVPNKIKRTSWNHLLTIIQLCLKFKHIETNPHRMHIC